MSNLSPLDAANIRDTLRCVRDWPHVATLWDSGDGVAVFELTQRDGLIVPEVIAALGATHGLVADGFNALVFTSSDPRLLAFGAAGPFRHTIQTGDTAPSLAFLLDGQATLHALRLAPFPFVVAVHGLAFSGACEVALFANGLVAEEAAPIALKEVWVGLIPGWGGSCQLMLRQQNAGIDPFTSACIALGYCARGHIAQGIEEGRRTNLFRPHDCTVTERAELFPAAKRMARSLVGTTKPIEALVHLPPSTAVSNLEDHVSQLNEELQFAPAEAEAMQTLLDLLKAHADSTLPETHYMAHEAHAFVPLLKPSLGPRFAHLAATGQRPPRE